MNSDTCRMLHSAVCLINAVAALHLGLMAFNINLLHMGFLAGLATPLAYVFGISGVLGLVFFFAHNVFCGCSSGSCSR